MKIRRWGNSLAIRIPATIAKQLGLHEGDDVEVALTSGGLVLSAHRKKKYRLEDLLAKVKDGSNPMRILKSGSVGKELL